jgi:hypothetical protein
MQYASETCDHAKNLVQGDRQEQHGDKYENHMNIATLWSAYLKLSISPDDVAVLFALAKVGRTLAGNYNPDDYIDAVGYMAIAHELKSKREDELQHERSKNTE